MIDQEKLADWMPSDEEVQRYGADNVREIAVMWLVARDRDVFYTLALAALVTERRLARLVASGDTVN
jgi:hypothetical protein